ncbi:MAG: hypothetical protein U0271_20585 [Polyangiaceae bacterium]
MRKLATALSLVVFGSLAYACGDDTESGDPPCNADTDSGCENGQVCENVSDGTTACFDPVTVKGRVFDLAVDTGVAGARVVARDENGVALSRVAISEADGTYALAVPATRDASGAPVSQPFTLRADASGYQSFPTPPRVALPLDVSDATGSPPAIEQANTDIGLIALEDTTGLGSISGTVVAGQPGGTLVDAGGYTGIADRDGEFVIFNVPAGTVSVTGYKQGINFDPTTADVVAGQETAGVTIQANDRQTVTVSGSVQIVNGMGSSATSVILVLEDTFDDLLIRGEAPPGLRDGGVTGAFSIDGVPDGQYVVLAAFENDGLVRDPDTSIGGTEIVHITVDGQDIAISQGFKVTGALDVVSPGADGIETVSAPVTFTWEDDSSEDEYHVQVFDAFGTLVWETTGNFDPGGNKPATVDYAGPDLESGMLYQFRATSIKAGVPISSTEDLKGVFMFQ